MKTYDRQNVNLTEQFKRINWVENSGFSADELKAEYEKFYEKVKNEPKSIIKALTYDFVLKNARIAIDREDIFQDKIDSANIMSHQRYIWKDEVIKTHMQDDEKSVWDFRDNYGAFDGHEDFGHVSPNSELLLKIGFTGILERINKYSERDGLTEKQKNFYKSARITFEAILAFVLRLADAVRDVNPENAKALESIAKSAPRNTYEALQMIIIYFFVHEKVGGSRVRSLGRLDIMLEPFYKKDIADGTYTREEISEMLKFFFGKFYAFGDQFGTPLCIGGVDEDGNDVTSEMTYLIVEAFDAIDVNSPKIHVRVSKKSPEKFVKTILRNIRGGNSSYVFVSDESVVKSLMKVDISESDARNYVPIGCYEPAVWGKEMGCTGAGHINLPKAIELVINNGRDFRTGDLIGVETGMPDSFDALKDAIKAQIAFFMDYTCKRICGIEKYYSEIYPDPILSAMYDKSAELGVDLYEGSAEYNNTAINIFSIASLVDSVAAIKRLVYDEKRLTLAELFEILKNNWEGNEKLRLIARNLPEKYGNGNESADALTKEFSEYCSSLLLGRKNARGGVFKPGFFSINNCFATGAKTMATPDGRNAGEPLSKNLCATVGVDRNGITALINSVCCYDHSIFPNGSVLDIVLHPSAVSGEEGLEAFYGILMTYFAKGGMAVHGNVFDPEVLRAAQKYPEKYANLQVRLCGWNAYFVNLTKAEQDSFIRHSEVAY